MASHTVKKAGWITGVVIMSVLTLLVLAADVVLLVLL